MMPIQNNKKMDYKATFGFDLNDYIIENIDIILISSIPGSYNNQNLRKYGSAKVGEINAKFKTFLEPNAIYKSSDYLLTSQCTSLG